MTAISNLASLPGNTVSIFFILILIHSFYVCFILFNYLLFIIFFTHICLIEFVFFVVFSFHFIYFKQSSIFVLIKNFF